MKRIMPVLIILLLIVFGGYVAMVIAVPRISPRPENLGVVNGQFAACPDTPNCVSTQSERQPWAMEAIPYTGTQAETKEKLMNLLREAEDATIIDDERPDYIYAEFRTQLMRFIDDVEFYIDDENKLIHFRSASRLGRSDLGKNRARMEQISQQLRGQV